MTVPSTVLPGPGPDPGPGPGPDGAPPDPVGTPAGSGRVRRAVAAHPVAALLLWFFTVGQAVAFVPVFAAADGASLPVAPFVIASNLVGLALPAVVVTGLAGGREALRELGRRLVPARVTRRWCAFALVVVPLVTVALAVLLSGPPAGASAATVGWAVLAGLLLQTVLGLLTSNLTEEVAWTGVVQARLQARRGPMVAALLTGPLFALQHAALAVGNAGSQALLLLAFLVVLAIPFRALLGWAYNRTGSLLLVGLIHAAGNASAGGSGLGDGLLTLLYPGRTAGPLHLVGAALLGLAVILATRGRLGLPRRPAGGDPARTSGAAVPTGTRTGAAVTNPHEYGRNTAMSSTWHVRDALLLLMSGGFFVHLISASRHLADDSARVGDILLRPVDAALFVLMLYCAVVLLTRSRAFARAYDLRSRSRRVGYWAITAYVTVSLPGHVLFLLTGDTRFFDGFPWWFSLVILPVYALVVAYVVTLRPHPAARTTPVAAGPADATDPVQRPVGAAALPARS